jgi:hypothetical protein
VKYSLGRILGLGIFLFWSSFLVLYILVVPLGYYIEYNNLIPPDWYAQLLSVELFSWNYFVTIQQAIWISTVGGAFMWIGWQIMNPMTVDRIQTVDRRKIVAESKESNEKFLEEIKETPEEYKSIRKSAEDQ